MTGSAGTSAVLCRRVREHDDQAAFAELVRRNRVAIRLTVREFRWAERGYLEHGDLWQETLLAFWQAARDFEDNRRATYTRMAKVYARNRILTAVARERTEKRRREREALSLQARSPDPERLEDGDTLGDTIAAPEYWEPEVIAQIRADLRLLSSELPQALSPVEHEALARVMLDESNGGRSGTAMIGVRRKASRLLGYEWRPSRGPAARERRERGLRLLADGHTTREVARRVGVSQVTAQRWNSQARQAA